MIPESQTSATTFAEPALHLSSISVRYRGGGGTLAVDNFTATLYRGESVCLLGESGCGKTTLCRLLLGTIPPDADLRGSVHCGSIAIEAKDRRRTALPIRVACIPQEPRESMHPMLKAGTVLAEIARAHHAPPRRRQAVAAAMQAAELPEPWILKAYPHELSGGQRQRVLIAQALLCRPDLLIADEPTSALDVILEASVIRLIKGLVKERGMSLLWVTHNPLLCAGMHRVLVMSEGRLIEETTPARLLGAPQHPYTVKLIQALPPPLGESPSADR
ncbi:MAG: ABC transporter ATP-binding protein [Acidobacteria bacterium]|nr:ABC transporter ATP-binding protein [Acidobacteriota bacterium]